jgi:hypothetical protein
MSLASAIAAHYRKVSKLQEIQENKEEGDTILSKSI